MACQTTPKCERLQLLFLTQVLPYPLDAGPKVRAYYMLRHLAGRHRVTLVSFVRPDDRPEYIEHLRTIAHAVYTVPMRRSLARNLAAGLGACSPACRPDHRHGPRRDHRGRLA